MKSRERLTHRVTFRSGMIAAAATMLLTLPSTSERVMAFATRAATVVGLASAPLAAAENNDTAIRPFRVNVPEADLTDDHPSASAMTLVRPRAPAPSGSSVGL